MRKPTMALRTKIRPNEAEPEGYGGFTVEGENEVWPDFRRNPGPPATGLRRWGGSRRAGANFPRLVVDRR